MKNVKETLENYAIYCKFYKDDASSKNVNEALDELENFKNFCIAIMAGYENCQISHENFRVQVARWADENLKRLENLGI